MLGALIGDIVGSRFEFLNTNEKISLFHNACTWTDDTVCTVAVEQACKKIYNYENNTDVFKQDGLAFEEMQFIFAKYLKYWGRKFPMAGYGANFGQWILHDDMQPYGSFGNGALMRVSSVIQYSHTFEQAQVLAKAATSCSHNHPMALECVDKYIELLWTGLQGKKDGLPPNLIHELVLNKSNELQIKNLSCNEYLQKGGFHLSCNATLERIIACYKEANSFSDALQNANYIGGDTDTNCAIVGALAEITWKIDDYYLYNLTKFFNHKNNELLKNIVQSYLNSVHIEIYPQDLINFCIQVLQNKFIDFTAQYDPLELPTDAEYFKNELIKKNIFQVVRDKILHFKFKN